MSKVPVIVGLGETLWDVFPDGPRLGGAPLNFSCSTAELGKSAAHVFIVSAVGNDELGRRATECLAGHGVDTTCMQTNDRPTGQVLVELDAAGVASYRFAENCAWDNLVWNSSLQALAEKCNAVCFGTLGQRSECSGATIRKFVNETDSDTLRILDVNLRSPFFADSIIRQSLDAANVLKLNDDELPVLAELCGVGGSDVEVLQKILQNFQLRMIALTRGARGAVLMSGSEVSDLPGKDIKVVDTVGAGDAFTAAMTLGILAGRDIAIVNRSAIAAASYVCSRPGATMSFPQELLQS
ncbi:MAG: carbohydrate kinase [Planctomycetaceae bacterium]|nr:carbohydrate kinase [Planctomycetaceae bacterium]